MGQVRHGCATTTHAVRAAIQRVVLFGIPSSTALALIRCHQHTRPFVIRPDPLAPFREHVAALADTPAGAGGFSVGGLASPCIDRTVRLGVAAV
jgi:hypothetical protein